MSSSLVASTPTSSLFDFSSNIVFKVLTSLEPLTIFLTLSNIPAFLSISSFEEASHKATSDKLFLSFNFSINSLLILKVSFTLL